MVGLKRKTTRAYSLRCKINVRFYVINVSNIARWHQIVSEAKPSLPNPPIDPTVVVRGYCSKLVCLYCVRSVYQSIGCLVGRYLQAFQALCSGAKCSPQIWHGCVLQSRGERIEQAVLSKEGGGGTEGSDEQSFLPLSLSPSLCFFRCLCFCPPCRCRCCCCRLSLDRGTCLAHTRSICMLTFWTLTPG